MDNTDNSDKNKFIKELNIIVKHMIKSKIIIINQSLPPKSTYEYSKLLYDAASPNSKLINLINPTQLTKNIEHLGIDIEPRIKKYSLYYLFPKLYYRKAQTLIKNNYGDSIIHYSLQGMPRIENNKKYLYSVHDNPFKIYNTNLYNYEGNKIEKIKNRFLKSVFNKYVMTSKYIITNTNYVRKSVIKWGYKGYIFHISIPPSQNFYNMKKTKNTIRKQLGLPENKKLLLSISDNEIRKNIKLVNELNNIMNDEYKIIRVGSPLPNSINFKNISEEYLNLIYNAADALIFPSLEEGEGIPILEAFKTGLPVVASDIEPFKEIGGDAVIYIDPLNPKSFYNGVKEAINSREQLIENENIQINKFSFDIFRKQIMSVYNKINDDTKFY